MKLVRRPPQKERADVELVLGVLFLPLLAAASMLLTWIPAAWLPRCMLHTSWGIPCPTCGASRSIRLLATGQPVGAWRMQPLVVTLVAIAALFSLYAFVVVLGRLPRLRLVDVSRREKRVLWIGAAAVVLLNWMYLFWSGV